MTAGAIFRNCGESSTSTVHSVETTTRTDSTCKWSHFAVQRPDGDRRFTSFAVVCFGTVVSFLVFFSLPFFSSFVATPSPPSRLARRNDNAHRYFTSRSAGTAWNYYNRTNGESKTSVEGNS